MVYQKACTKQPDIARELRETDFICYILNFFEVCIMQKTHSTRFCWIYINCQNNQ